ncbi:unnamed protein product [Albugo candida]|uniref:Uncharacterized protein n=1 Tax=Albugo candida TaxID=65357 RepID=A0A024FSY2_9STRA|nr:unnamed protein product [Albugo candida]|eukprot:CCI10056.1 unnamed protein product [Albugo candida]
MLHCLTAFILNLRLTYDKHPTNDKKLPTKTHQHAPRRWWQCSNSGAATSGKSSATSAASETISIELQRLREGSESLKRKIGHLKDSKAQSDSTLTHQNEVVFELTQMIQIMTMRLQQQETGADIQNDSIEKLSLLLKTTGSELGESNN